MTKNTENIKIKLAILETKLDEIKRDIIDIKNNHLTSIYKKLDNQKTWLISILVSVILLLIGVFVNLIS